MKSESLKLLGKVGLYFLLPLALITIPTAWLEGRRSVCLIRNLFGIKCPGCGMIRAMSYIFHGDLKGAIHHNKLVVIVFPLLCYTWLRSVTAKFRRYALL
jgi:uncharacterized protein DUF2752